MGTGTYMFAVRSCGPRRELMQEEAQIDAKIVLGRPGGHQYVSRF